ncbi:putative peptide ABC transporter permease [Actinacidiphila reveromycinica]|uniref:Putative peptide ABC transporter permease n=1 Tax=Actinacidiphila reveromycinica TaxID=659352 RepID=A0A7U3VST5_9ACTN|nr:ABC transporter permease [Streptomyces sp. SN-593]BBB02175.1 putative peptide ABC transporter permease [Streptomyces sp. SN-593]
MTTHDTPAAPPGGAGSAGAPEAGALAVRHGSGRLTAAAFLRNPRALVGLGIVAVVAAFCFVGPLLYRTDQVTVHLDLAELPPGGGHPLGTDASGYDVLGRLMAGGRSSLELGFAVALATTLIGTLYGAFAGYFGGFVDAVMMRAVDTFLAIPGLVLLLIVVSMFTPSLGLIIVVLSLLSWLGAARLVRGEVLTLRTREFVQAARMMGGTGRRIVLRHLVPNAAGVIIVSATFTIADSILTLSALSFLGLGLPPPHADWGTMLTGGLDYLYDGYWWLVYPPAVILIITVVAFNLIGDAVHDALDVRLHRT